jgi:hypothetical protein
LKKKIDSPSANALYEILRRDINTLITHDLIHYNPVDLQEGAPQEVTRSTIPDAAWVEKHLYNKPNTVPRELCRIAELAKDLSGRTLRRLPMLALAQYTVDQPCNIGEFLVALKRVIREEKEMGDEASTLQEQEISSSVSDIDDIDIALHTSDALLLQDLASSVPIR